MLYNRLSKNNIKKKYFPGTQPYKVFRTYHMQKKQKTKIIRDINTAETCLLDQPGSKYYTGQSALSIGRTVINRLSRSVGQHLLFFYQIIPGRARVKKKYPIVLCCTRCMCHLSFRAVKYEINQSISCRHFTCVTNGNIFVPVELIQ